MFTSMLRMFRRKPRGALATVPEQAAARDIVQLLSDRVFCGPTTDELTLTGDAAKDAVPNFRWMHAKARDVVSEFLEATTNIPHRVRTEAQSLHESASRVAELLAPSVAVIDDVAEPDRDELADHMKRFLGKITVLGEVAQGKPWPPVEQKAG